MQDFQTSTFIIIETFETISKQTMKTMKIWRLTLMMVAALSLASCSSDDEDYDVNNLVGTWLKVYDEGVVSEGFVEYTFSNNGDCDIRVYDVFAGDTTLHRGYVLKDNRQLVIYEPMYGGTTESQTWNIKELGSSTMSWERADRSDIIYKFKRAAHQR